MIKLSRGNRITGLDKSVPHYNAMLVDGTLKERGQDGKYLCA